MKKYPVLLSVIYLVQSLVGFNAIAQDQPSVFMPVANCEIKAANHDGPESFTIQLDTFALMALMMQVGIVLNQNEDVLKGENPDPAALEKVAKEIEPIASQAMPTIWTMPIEERSKDPAFASVSVLGTAKLSSAKQLILGILSGKVDFDFEISIFDSHLSLVIPANLEEASSSVAATLDETINGKTSKLPVECKTNFSLEN